jgi:hypothetical protein
MKLSTAGVRHSRGAGLRRIHRAGE